ncbi:tetratricopeptide repeat protein [Streptomyces fructofermentans]|uniref:AfsR/SARP family transcriptional regulator n=1 Tax=Streptomyces fructofermentans TaxID=152141 RepID=UPI0033DD040A
MELCVLGPLELRSGGRRFDLGQPRQRAVLAGLAAEPGRLVTVDALVDRVWDDSPPEGARAALYSHISRIRRVLEKAARAEGEGHPPLRVRRGSGGYVLEADPGRIDLTRFRALLARANGDRLPDVERSGILREALGLWRGVPLAGLAGAWADRTRTAWSHERLEAAISWAGIELRLGRPREVISLIRPLLAEHPLAEPLAALLVRALADSARTAEALDLYASIRRRLAEELGVDPGSELRSAHEAVLRDGPSRTAPDIVALPVAPAAAPVPAQLPADVSAFTGRTRQLAELDTHLLAPGPSSPGSTTVVVSAVSGTAGVGKTALAVRWAHGARQDFPDGQLYVNLRGYDPEEPLPAAEALAGFLDALGVPGPEIPLRLDDRAARYRTEISGRRLLVVLDNASSAEQVRPLLPGTPSCRVLVTSRDSLASLVSVHGAHRLVLDVLSPDDALALLRTLAGERVDAEEEAASTLAEQCGRLPLALRVAAELALSRPRMTLADLVAELDDHRRRLRLLDSDGDPRAAVRAVFSWSYERLPPVAAKVFRLLGLHPGPDFDVHAAAALCAEPLDRTRQALDLLARASLVQPARTDRYAMHDLLRVYASWQADRTEGADGRDAALTRLLDHCLSGAAAAMDVLYPAERHLRPDVAAPDHTAPPLVHASECHDWLRTERPVLVALSAAAAGLGRADHCVRMSLTLHHYFERSGHYADALTLHAHALRAARQAGEERGEADLLACLGTVHRRLARYAEATGHHVAALAICRRIGHRTGEARNLTNLGVLHELQGQYRQSAEHHAQAVVLFRAVGDRGGEADVLNNLGIVHELLNDYVSSAEHHRRALLLYRELGHAFGEASALGNLGIVVSRLGDHDAAADHYEQALALFRRLGHRGGEAHALTNLGDALAQLGRHQAAVKHQRDALAVFQQTGERYGEAGALNGLGEALHGDGHSADASAAHTAALDLAREINEQEEQARAHIGLARVRQGHRDLAAARYHWEQALTLYTALDSPRAADVRARLAALAGEEAERWDAEG